MDDKKLIEKIKKLKQEDIDVTPYESEIRVRFNKLMEKEKIRKTNLKRLAIVFASITLVFMITLHFIIGESFVLEFKEGKEIIPEEKAFSLSIESVPDVGSPLTYDKELNVIWFVENKNGRSIVCYYDLAKKTVNALLPYSNNPSGTDGDIKIFGKNVYVGLGDCFEIVNRFSKELSIVELGDERFPIRKEALFPIKNILPVTDDLILISRVYSSSISIFNPYSLKINEWQLPMRILSPDKMIKGNDKIFFASEDINKGNSVIGEISLSEKTIKVYRNINASQIAFSQFLFAVSNNDLYKIDPEMRVYQKIKLKMIGASCLMADNKFIYIVSLSNGEIFVNKYDSQNNMVYTFSQKLKEIGETVILKEGEDIVLVLDISAFY